jgi:hypothetical protein
MSVIKGVGKKNQLVSHIFSSFILAQEHRIFTIILILIYYGGKGGRHKNFKDPVISSQDRKKIRNETSGSPTPCIG